MGLPIVTLDSGVTLHNHINFIVLIVDKSYLLLAKSTHWMREEYQTCPCSVLHRFNTRECLILSSPLMCTLILGEATIPWKLFLIGYFPKTGWRWADITIATRAVMKESTLNERCSLLMMKHTKGDISRIHSMKYAKTPLIFFHKAAFS